MQGLLSPTFAETLQRTASRKAPGPNFSELFGSLSDSMTLGATIGGCVRGAAAVNKMWWQPRQSSLACAEEECEAF